MSEQTDGGPAFPILQECEGMSLRDYFAARAMQALISTPDYLRGNWSNGNVAQDSYALADAMLTERAA